jgi:hypothetical protein
MTMFILSDVLTAMSINIQVFWDVTLCQLVNTIFTQMQDKVFPLNLVL